MCRKGRHSTIIGSSCIEPTGIGGSRMKRLRRFLLPAVLATIALVVVGLADPAAASTRPAAGQAEVTGSEPLAVYRTCIAYVGSPYPWDRDRGGVNSGANCNGVYGVSIITYLYHYEFDH